MSSAADQARCLHLGGTPGTWASLGWWPEAPQATGDYAGACTRLARAVGEAAGLAPGQRVLSLACGAGDELLLWAEGFGAAEVLGIEHDAAQAQRARDLTQARHGSRAGASARIQVLCRSAGAGPTGLAGLAARADHADPAGGQPFDAIVCVDAAYHLSPRAAWLAALWPLLRPGGRLAYTDLVLDRAPTPALRAMARACGVVAADLLPVAGQLQRLQAAAFVDVQAQRLDEAVLDGFARFLPQQLQRCGARPWQAGWRRAAATAALIPRARAAGLGCALLWARRPL